jgi:hypothetical protein
MSDDIRTEVRRDPTPKEIARVCREIQAEWSPQTERSRRVTHSPEVGIPEAGRASLLGGIDSLSDS